MRNLLKIIHTKNESTAKYLDELTKFHNKRRYQSTRLQRQDGQIDHTLLLFNDTEIDISQISQLAHSNVF